jgi:hypothetical protein
LVLIGKDLFRTRKRFYIPMQTLLSLEDAKISP